MYSTKTYQFSTEGFNELKKDLINEKYREYTIQFVRVLAFLMIIGFAPTVSNLAAGSSFAFKQSSETVGVAFKLLTKSI